MHHNRRIRCRPLLYIALALSAVTLSACSQNGNITFLGYTTEPNYDPTIRTVWVPMCENVSFRRGIEFDLTRAIQREIEANTPFKLASCRERADTELLCKVINWRKSVINSNQLNETREAEIGLAVELVWRDLRPGCGGILSAPVPPGGVVQPGAPPPPPILVEPVAAFIPELGGSVTSAERLLVDQLARGIIYKMELARPW